LIIEKNNSFLSSQEHWNKNLIKITAMTKKSLKSYRQLERLVRGFVNHRRIEIMELLYNGPELSVVEIAENLKINFKTASEYIRRLAIAGLVLKRSAGASVQHKLTEKGEVVFKFLRTLE